MNFGPPPHCCSLAALPHDMAARPQVLKLSRYYWSLYTWHGVVIGAVTAPPQLVSGLLRKKFTKWSRSGFFAQESKAEQTVRNIKSVGALREELHIGLKSNDQQMIAIALYGLIVWRRSCIYPQAGTGFG